MKRVKYDGEWSRIEHLAQQMSGLMTDFGPIDGLIPVPLHRSRERSRGFNQSRILAVELGKLSGVPVLDMLRRSRKTESQVSLSGDQRRENVTGAFGVDPAWMPRAGGHYVIVDDVRTTGSTLGACAEALQAVSPSAISVVTFALDMHRDQVRALRDHLATSGVRGGGHS
ncbi:MAG TPA: phosphoribosyltransferase family protein [Thermomicrobiales bacterium]|nr:phosphoribosyltransferase family protein [Thermomicrobiales bacterium]